MTNMRPTQVVLAALAFVGGVLGLWAFVFEYEGSSAVASGIVGFVFAVTISYVVSRLTSSSLPIAYGVAFVGFPVSGKTTLITAIFGEIFARRVLYGRVVARGESTIERINEQLERLERGQAIGPTSDQDRFSYRADMTLGSGPFRRVYKVEFGDFPGEDSVEYAERGTFFAKSEYFKWVAQSDAVVFVVDVASFLLVSGVERTSYVAGVKRAVRSSWQHLLDSTESHEKGVRQRSIVLAFTKCDVFGTLGEPVDIISTKIAHLGFSGEVPPVRPIDEGALAAGQEIVAEAFDDLITYLRGEVRAFRVVWISSFATRGGFRMGIPELLDAVLPRGSRSILATLKAEIEASERAAREI